MKQSAKYFRGSWVGFAFGCLVLLLIILQRREDRAARAQLLVTNSSDVPVAVQYRGHYEPVRVTIPPGGVWSNSFRDFDVLVIKANYDGLALSNSVLLTTSDAPAQPPRSVYRELHVVRELHSAETGELLQALVMRSVPFPDWTEAPLKSGFLATNIVCW
jgi:hypothetical protein